MSEHDERVKTLIRQFYTYGKIIPIFPSKYGSHKPTISNCCGSRVYQSDGKISGLLDSSFPSFKEATEKAYIFGVRDLLEDKVKDLIPNPETWEYKSIQNGVDTLTLIFKDE